MIAQKTEKGTAPRPSGGLLGQLDTNRKRLFRALLLVVFVFCFGTVGFRVLSPGPEGWLKCAYMTIISLTTVGYGEAVPVDPHPHMMAFTILLLLGGIGVITYAFGSVAAFFVEGTLKEAFWKRRMAKRLADLSGHYIVCGAGETGLTAIRELHQTQRDFVVIETDADALGEVIERYDPCVVEGDATDDDSLREAGIERARGLLAVLPSDKDNLFLVVTAKQLNDKLRIIAKVTDPVNNQKFLKAGADGLASPQMIGGMRLVSEMIRPAVVSFLDLMLRDKDRSIRIEDIEMGAGSQYEDSSLRDASFREEFSVQIMALRAGDDERFDYSPDPDKPIAARTTLIVLGEAGNVARLREALEPSG